MKVGDKVKVKVSCTIVVNNKKKDLKNRIGKIDSVGSNFQWIVTFKQALDDYNEDWCPFNEDELELIQ
jgi:hypothetical protein